MDNETIPPIRPDTSWATTPPPSTIALDVGSIIARSINLLKAHWLILCVQTLCICVIPGVFLGVLTRQLDGLTDTSDPIGRFVASAQVVVEFGGSYVLQIVSTWTLVDRVFGNNPNRRSLGNVVLAAIGLLILSTLGIMLGLLLLIIPGIIVATRWSVAFPLLLAQNISPIQALGRSYQLVGQNFWPVFWSASLAFILVMVLVGGLQLLALTSLGLDNEPASTLIITSIFEPWTYLIWNVGAVAIYYELTAGKGGLETGRLAEIFD